MKLMLCFLSGTHCRPVIVVFIMWCFSVMVRWNLTRRRRSICHSTNISLDPTRNWTVSMLCILRHISAPLNSLRMVIYFGFFTFCAGHCFNLDDSFYQSNQQMHRC